MPLIRENKLKGRLISTMNIRNDFAIEFFAYNISISEIKKKIYIRLLSDTKDAKKVVLSDKQLQLMSFALDNKYLSSFCSNRYCLFDISLRELKDTSNVGFSFNDVCDYIFIDPSQIFEPFMEFGIDKLINTIRVVQQAMFQQKPHYNPIFMIGMVMDKSILKSLKAYIRYDLAEAPTSVERENIIKAVSRAINSKIKSTSSFFDVAEKLENLGFIFSFIGVDLYADGVERYKIYFRSYEDKNWKIIEKEITDLLLHLGLNDRVQTIFNKHKNGMWGIALSTDSFENINRVQLYFNP